jgi:hypothetical protein
MEKVVAQVVGKVVGSDDDDDALAVCKDIQDQGLLHQDKNQDRD